MRRSRSPTFSALVERGLNRREVLASGTALAIMGALAGCARSAMPQAAGVGFAPIAGSSADAVRVPDGYRVDVVVRWGDALFGDTLSLTSAGITSGALLAAGAADRQARQFGYNCDGLGLFETADDRLVACVNHEFPSPSLMFPGWHAASLARTLDRYVIEHPESVAVMQAAVGLSVLELEYRDAWKPVRDSRFNRRLTAHAPIEMAGPARLHPLVGDGEPCYGTLGNCAAGVTPWGTYLTAEENVQDYFGNAPAARFSDLARRVHDRFGNRRRDSLYRWEYVDPRFDLAQSPNEPFKFGWIVELDPRDPSQPIRKRTALGRFKHEAATVALTSDGRAAVYMGDDAVFEYFYKFVSSAQVRARNPAANRDLLDAGVLHVARLYDDGSGEWLPLVWSDTGPLSPETGFESPADVVLDCRRAADLLGATPLDRPEDVAICPLTQRVYLACTNNSLRGDPERPTIAGSGASNRVDAANPRRSNRNGHILEFHEHNGDAGATRFSWAVLVLAGRPTVATLVPEPSPPLADDAVYFGGLTDDAGLSPFASPDNLTFDARGNLWVVADGAQPLGANNGCFVCTTTGRGAVRSGNSCPDRSTPRSAAARSRATSARCS